MIFSSPFFLFVFFPVFFLLYSLLPRALRNSFILLASLAFYVCGAGALTVVALSLVFFNWALARLIGKIKKDPARQVMARAIFLSTVLINLSPLIFF